MTGIASWDPERELNRDANARPAADDEAGWLRFYAGRFEEADGVNRGWGRGRWRYDGGCQSCHARQVADKFERLQLENAELKVGCTRRGHRQSRLSTPPVSLAYPLIEEENSMPEAKPIIYLRDLLGFIQNLDGDAIVTLDGSPEYKGVPNGPGVTTINLTALMALLERDKQTS